MSDDAAPKHGLALSGGGFRAAFFHVGVLARLADQDLLRRIEVISTVSGGSIVGAAYYIRLKQLLESRPDAKIEPGDYRNVVAEVEELLRDAVDVDIRARVFRNLFKNLRMASPGYSRSQRIGDLYDHHLYRPAWGNGRSTPVALRELLVRPPDGPEDADFRPSLHNAGRVAKVPVLSLNATCLNTGRNWRFEAERMGEPGAVDQHLAPIEADVNKNLLLAQGYFDPDTEDHPIPGALRDFPLAHAVAASAGVPGVFHPLAINDMYGGVRVRLVDGGVHDNQGIQGLHDTRCDVHFVSDASRQLGDEPKPSPRVWKVLPRTVGIQGDRIRDEQLVRGRQGDEIRVMHLRKGLDAQVVQPGATFAEGEAGGTTAEFGVHPRVQEALSAVRTDLDRFSDLEAMALELDGYRMTRHVFRCADPSTGWEFEAVSESVESGPPDVVGHLKSGSEKFFRPARRASWFLALLMLAVLAGGVALWAIGAGGWVAREIWGWPECLRLLVLPLAVPFVLFAWANLLWLCGPIARLANGGEVTRSA